MPCAFGQHTVHVSPAPTDPLMLSRSIKSFQRLPLMPQTSQVQSEELDYPRVRGVGTGARLLINGWPCHQSFVWPHPQHPPRRPSQHKDGRHQQALRSIIAKLKWQYQQQRRFTSSSVHPAPSEFFHRFLNLSGLNIKKDLNKKHFHSRGREIINSTTVHDIYFTQDP